MLCFVMDLSRDELFKQFSNIFRGNRNRSKKKTMDFVGITMVAIRRSENEIFGPGREAVVKVSKHPAMKIICIQYQDGNKDPLTRDSLSINFEDIESTSSLSEPTYILKLHTKTEVKFTFGSLNEKMRFVEASTLDSSSDSGNSES